MRRVLCLLLLLCVCHARAKSDRFRVLAFNVENLFDTKDAPEKADETYLPFSEKPNLEHAKKCLSLKSLHWAFDCYYLDWNERAYSEKLKRIAAVLDDGQKEGLFDAVFLEEVENESVLQDLNRLLQQPFPYIFHKESSDKRGIDVALLSRHKAVAGPELHSIKFRAATKQLKKDWREILYVKVLWEGVPVHLFGVHFPAPFHKWSYRQDAFSSLNALKNKVAAAELSIAAGDFNVPRRESKKSYFKTATASWDVSHELGCEQCQGTHFWEKGKEWSFLDMILVSHPKAPGAWSVDPTSIKLQNSLPFQKNSQGQPQRWDQSGPEILGLSDHWPIRLDVIIRQ